MMNITYSRTEVLSHLPWTAHCLLSHSILFDSSYSEIIHGSINSLSQRVLHNKISFDKKLKKYVSRKKADLEKKRRLHYPRSGCCDSACRAFMFSENSGE